MEIPRVEGGLGKSECEVSSFTQTAVSSVKYLRH